MDTDRQTAASNVMNRSRHNDRQQGGDDSRRPGLLGGLGIHLVTGLAMYRGWHS
jgi:hypothetical protein